jgi:hypothetical protein
MGGRPEPEPEPRPTMTVYQPIYPYFEVAYSPDIEERYAAMLAHPSNYYRHQMAQSYAEQQNGQNSEYIFVPGNGLEARIGMRDNDAATRALQDRMQALNNNNN